MITFIVFFDIILFLVKRKFGNDKRDSELFFLAPTASPPNPILMERFSGRLKNKGKRNIIIVLIK